MSDTPIIPGLSVEASGDIPTPLNVTVTMDQKADQLISLVSGLTNGMDESNRQIALSNERIAESNRAISTLASSVADNKKAAHRMKVWQVVTIIGLCFDLMLSAGFFYNQNKANDAINKNANNATAVCVASNVTRADALKLWTKILEVPKNAPAAQITTLQADLYLAQTIYAPKVCAS